MEVKQIYQILNTISGELLGESAVVQEDLSNIVELGATFASVAGLDNYVKALNDQIGRMVFVNRMYKGRLQNAVLRDGWEYGSIMEKVSMELPDAAENESWELTNGTSYDPNVFTKPTVSVSCWNKRVTFEIPISLTERQVKSSFASVMQMNAFMSMIYTAIQNSMTIKLDALVMRTINNLIAETVHDDYASAALSSKSGVKAVNLLYLYNAGPNSGGTALTVAEALTNPEFIRFASYTMANYMDRLGVMSTLFNIQGKERFTPSDRMHVVLLSEFASAAGAYLQSDTFNARYTALPNAETVPFWQGSGEDYAFDSTGKIYLSKDSSGDAVTVTGLLGVMFDHDALGVACMDRRVTTQYNAKAEFFNEWHKMDAGYFNDSAENCVCFFVA